jgi:hypothetical protein
VNTRASVLTALVGERSSQILVNRAMAGIALGTQLAQHNRKRGRGTPTRVIPGQLGSGSGGTGTSKVLELSVEVAGLIVAGHLLGHLTSKCREQEHTKGRTPGP